MTTAEIMSSALSTDIKWLGGLLGTIIREQHGDDALALVEQVRKLAKARRGGDDSAQADLVTLIDNLDDEQLRVLTKAFSNYFQLINMAEDQERIRVLRQRELEGTQQETIDNALATFVNEGMDAADVRAMLEKIELRLVLTAHPSEAKRQEVLIKLREVALMLGAGDRKTLIPREEATLAAAIAERIEELWHTRATRATKATVRDEVQFGLYFLSHVIMDEVVDVHEDLRAALEQHYPDEDWSLIPIVVRFASWVGGDRDGNPNVTADVTLETLKTLRAAAREAYLADVRTLQLSLTQAVDEVSASAAIIEAVRPTEGATSTRGQAASKYPGEIYRQQMTLIENRLESNAYRRSEELLSDLRLVVDSLRENNGTRSARGRVYRLMQKVRLFGLHLVPLEIREDARRHRAALSELLRLYGLAYDFENMPETQKQHLLTNELRNPRPLFPEEVVFSDVTNEVIATWRMIATAYQLYGPRCIDTVIASMSEQPSDVLTMLLLAREVSIEEHIAIVPLFETVEDLINAPTTTKTLFNNPEYAAYLKTQDHHQQIMLGYSDSNKDGGYLASNWNLYKAQAAISEACMDAGVRVTFFHGRGGSIGRGGGPSNRAILAAPLGSLHGRIKITEQGEVIGFRYSNPEIADRHLNQVLHAVFISTAKLNDRTVPQAWHALMDDLTEVGRLAYRDLVYESEGFLDYWQQTTPISELSRLQISSRPAKRSTGGFSAMRAIPWVFSWMQSRAIIPSWFGVGTALQTVTKDKAALEMLREMYIEWGFFRALMKNLQMDLVKADMGIAELYAGLAEDGLRSEFFTRIAQEHKLASDQVVEISQQQHLLETASVMRTSIERRNPYVDPLNFIQVKLLRELRELEPGSRDYDDKLRMVLATINGIAAGMKTTG